MSAALRKPPPLANKRARKRLRARLSRDVESRLWTALHSGFTAMLWGVGVNEQLVNEMLAKHLPTGACLTVVSCGHPSTTVKDVIHSLAHLTREGVGLLRGVHGALSQAQRLVNYLDSRASRSSRALYVVLHNIDSPVINVSVCF